MTVRNNNSERDQISPVGGEFLNVVSIPARSGSKRLKNKNIKKINGVPLLAYSIRFAKQLAGIDRVFVNTDSPEYAAIAREYGAETPFLRPANQASDTACLGDALSLLCEYLHKEEEVLIAKCLTLLPTSLFRNKVIVESALDAADEYRLVASVHEAQFNPQDYCIPRNGTTTALSSLIKEPFLDKCYTKGVGQFTIQGIDIMPIKRMKLFKISNVFELVDIDTEEDFKLAETIIREQLYDFGVDLGL